MILAQGDFQETFHQYDGFKTARLVTKRDGSSKCVAYVEFDSEANCAAALEKCNGIEIEGAF